MSLGFSNNNPGNLAKTSDNWEGATGVTYKTGDGNDNVQFQDMVFGLRALMTVIDNKIEKDGLSNMLDLIKSYAPNANGLDYRYVISKYLPYGFNYDNIDPTDENIGNIAKGIVENEIPEWNQINEDIWSTALNYYKGGSHTYNPDYDARDIKANSPANTSASFAPIFILLGLIAAGVMFFKKKING